MSTQPSNSSTAAKPGVVGKVEEFAERELQAGLSAFKSELAAHVYVIIAIAAGLGGVIGALIGHAL